VRFASLTNVNKMADENIEVTSEEDSEDIDVDLDETSDNKVEKRIKELSKKVKLTSQERDELIKTKQKLEVERDSAKKEVEFYSSFSNATDKYPGAKDFKEKIKEKVLAGYTVEDATVAVLASEGKLTTPTETENVAGGSATNPPSEGGPKPLEEMTREEKREEVLKAVERGDISV